MSYLIIFCNYFIYNKLAKINIMKSKSEKILIVGGVADRALPADRARRLSKNASITLLR